MTRSKILLMGIGLAFLRSVASGQGYEPAGPRTWSAPLLWQPPAAERSRSLETKVASAETATSSAVTPLPLVTIAPCRQFDSRSSSPLLQGTTVDVTLTGAPCNIPVNAQAVSVNVTVFHINGATGNGVVTIGIPGGSSIGFVNYPPTQSQIDNAGTLPIDGSGQVSVSVAQGGGSIDFILDVNGYYAPNATVTSLNGMTGNLGIVAGQDVMVTPSPQTLTIAANSTSVNAPNTLVRRDGSGNFAAGSITGSLLGNATGFTDPLAGEVTGNQGATVVSNATPGNTPNAIVRRNGVGDIAVGNVFAGGYVQPGTGGENLKTIRGVFQGSDGSIAVGSGFTVTRHSTGNYTVNFTTLFSLAPPAMTCTIIDGVGGFVFFPIPYTTSAVNVVTVTPTGVAKDFQYLSFIAVGNP